MTVLYLLKLAYRQLLREARASELRILFAALVIAVASSTAIGYFTTRLNGAMLLRATDFLAADMVLVGSSPASQEQLDLAERWRLDHSRVVEFSTVIATDLGIQISSIKAVDNDYPLRGSLRSTAQPYQEEIAGSRPDSGEAWVEARLLNSLNLSAGDTIEIGLKPLVISRILTYEPDRAGNFHSLTPRVLMHVDDLPATGVIQPGSRVRYKELWRGTTQALAGYRKLLESTLGANQQIRDVHDSNPQIGGSLKRAERYLNLASLAAILLAGVAVALSASRFANKRFDTSALLRALGLKRNETLRLFALQLLLLGILACLFGALLGWLTQFGLFVLLNDFLPSVVPSGGIWPAFAGITTGLIALIGFSLPTLAALGRVPPLRVLRGELLPIPGSLWLTYGSVLLALMLIMWRLSLDLTLTLILVGAGLCAAVVLGGGLFISLRSLRRLMTDASLPWRLGLGQLLRHPLSASGQALAFGLILLAMALIAVLRSELLDTWKEQLPENAPNHFALNITSAEKETFIEAVEKISTNYSVLYPATPGRLTMINDKPVREYTLKNSQGKQAINRDLGLSWSEELPVGNQLVAGQWWSLPVSDSSSLPAVSVEEEIAHSFGLQLGDTLSFDIGGVRYDFQVRSLRKVNWDSFQPNFYMIFQPGVLQDAPTTHLLSFYLAPGQERALVELSRAFPTVTLVPIDALLNQVRDILAQVTLAIEYVLLFVLAAGLTVLMAGLQSTLDERIRQGALLRALGADRRLLLKARYAEFIILGACSGILAALGCELAVYLLYRFVINLSWQPHIWLLLLPVIGAMLVTIAGILGTRKVLNSSPLLVLRES